jgi:hypothetical protein
MNKENKRIAITKQSFNSQEVFSSNDILIFYIHNQTTYKKMFKLS